MNNNIEPQEIEALLEFYRKRYHQMVDTISFQNRLINQLKSELSNKDKKK